MLGTARAEKKDRARAKASPLARARAPIHLRELTRYLRLQAAIDSMAT
jgi:hypothetical protein